MSGPSNFSFLIDEWPTLFCNAQLAEQRATIEPVSSASYARLAMEEVLYQLYKLEGLDLPYNKGLHALLDNPEITELIGRARINGAHIIRKTGNAAAHHGQRVAASEARIAVKYLFDVCRWFALFYSEADADLPLSFDESLIQKIGEQARKRKEQEAEAAKQFEAMQAKLKAMEEERDAALAFAKTSNEEKLHLARLAEERAFTAVRREERLASPAAEKLRDSASFSESETRIHLIDADLRDAGWDQLRAGHELEYHVTGMPDVVQNPNGNGYIDYVLWGEDGLPLAVIEAKRTAKSPQLGRHQARLYADRLEAKFGRRPIIYYSNGFETYILDDTFYSAERLTQGFHKRDELELMIQRRNKRLDPRTVEVDRDIAGRPYQLAAIQAFTETLVAEGDAGQLRGNRRKGLLVMATGSGKTRTASALCKVLFESNWAKRVLFLADRTALVVQAKRSFSYNLPDYAAINLVNEADDPNARLVFSTYQTILNRINNGFASEDASSYGIGHFDLIIVDEAHRSVYNRYRAIFAYFDAVLLGLTATPKGSIDHNTYEFFGASTGDPTFSYELDEAVPTYLKGYRTVKADLGFMQHGVKYNQLSAAEKEKFEETFRDGDTGLFPAEIGANELNKKLFNKDTVDKVLDLLMTEGLRIEDGNSVGRTIVFAANQDHAEYIVKCFTERYPSYPAGFIEVIHNGVSHAQSLIDEFCDHKEEKLPRIAVSVDMMDTGIDAPRVLNLIFFKRVRSYAKFWQMIGRGTRLCPDVFGPGQPKEYFLIFDICDNFGFFDAVKNGIETGNQVSGATRLFRNRLQLMNLLFKSSEEGDVAFAKTLRRQLHAQTEILDARGDITVKMSARWVDKYKHAPLWERLGETEYKELHDHIAPLVAPDDRDVHAQRFDLLMVNLHLAKALARADEPAYYQKLETIATRLLEKTGIPEVAQREALLRGMTDPEFYKNQRQNQLDDLRKEVRGLIQYLDTSDQKPVYTNFEDTISYEFRETGAFPKMSAEIYRKRVAEYIRANQDQLVIRKLHTNRPITAEELASLETMLFDGEQRGTRQDFEEALDGDGVAEQGSLLAFVRSIIGLDPLAVDEIFAEFIQTNQLSAAQINFIDQIKQHLQRNGLLEPKALFKDPYTSYNSNGLTGVFDDAQAAKIVKMLRDVNEGMRVG